MITLTRKLKKDGASADGASEGAVAAKRVSIRDRLLVKEVQEMEQNMPSTCKVFFNDPNVLSEFTLIITPDEGFWMGGKFKFVAVVPEEYNMTVRRNARELTIEHILPKLYGFFRFRSACSRLV